MGKVSCPFCNSRNTFNIAYGYLKNNIKRLKKNELEWDEELDNELEGEIEI